MEWVVKARWYSGAESVMFITDSEDDAKSYVQRRNGDYQENTFYYEPYDPEKVKGFSGTPEQIDQLIKDLGENNAEG